MQRISEYEPKRVFHYFEEISKIPHGSYNTKEISDYLAGFAKAKGLKYVQDELGNVVIYVPASAGYEKAAPVILQGHMDMVCTVAPGKNIDMTKEALKLAIDGDWLYAENTTLGGDDGIAVAMILALAESDAYAHPALECVFTVDEETGLEGAEGFDEKLLTGRKMINLDSEDEGIITVSCAGGITGGLHLPVKREKVKGEVYSIKVAGLAGGHSGADINKELGNANVLMGRALSEIGKNTELAIAALSGGNADNVICMECCAEVVAKDGVALEKAVKELDAVLKNEYKTSDPGVSVKAEKKGNAEVNAVTVADSKRMIAFLLTAPYGIQNMSMDIDGLVETSLNIGIVGLEEGEMTATYALRSSVQSRMEYLQARLSAAAEALGGRIDYSLYYPGWEYRKDSSLRDTCVSVFKRMYGKEPKVEAIHAGLECGFFAGKLGDDFDAVSIGPDMRCVHTPDEKLSISSTERTFDYLLEILRECK
jgi:dipeptidase D